MPVLMDASTFVIACLLLGLGLFLAVDSAHQINRRRVALAARDVMTALGGLLVAAAAGGYWVSLAVH